MFLWKHAFDKLSGLLLVVLFDTSLHLINIYDLVLHAFVSLDLICINGFFMQNC